MASLGLKSGIGYRVYIRKHNKVMAFSGLKPRLVLPVDLGAIHEFIRLVGCQGEAAQDTVHVSASECPATCIAQAGHALWMWVCTLLASVALNLVRTTESHRYVESCPGVHLFECPRISYH